MAKEGGMKVKKLLIGMLITCSLGLAACGRSNTENSTTNDNAGTGVTDGTNGNNGMKAEDNTGITDGTNGQNGTGGTGGTNSNTNGTNNQGSSSNETKTSVNNLYTELKGKVAGGVKNINTEDWDNYSAEFRGKLENLRNTTTDPSVKTALDDIEKLYKEYDTAIRDKTDLATDKVQEMQNKIEDALK